MVIWSRTEHLVREFTGLWDEAIMLFFGQCRVSYKNPEGLSEKIRENPNFRSGIQLPYWFFMVHIPNLNRGPDRDIWSFCIYRRAETASWCFPDLRVVPTAVFCGMSPFQQQHEVKGYPEASLSITRSWALFPDTSFLPTAKVWNRAGWGELLRHAGHGQACICESKASLEWVNPRASVRLTFEDEDRGRQAMSASVTLMCVHIQASLWVKVLQLGKNFAVMLGRQWG